MERGPASERKALRGVNSYLAATLAPLLDEAFSRQGECRIQAVGHMGILPLLATPLAGGTLGSSPEIAYRHPRADVISRSEGARDAVQLLIVDRVFKGDAQRVEATALLAASRLGAECRVLSFNSETDRLRLDDLIDSLKSVSRAVIFCHVDTPVAVASAGGLILGPSSRLTLDVLASLNLKGLEELALIGCASGRINPFIGETTAAHAAAVAGAGEVLYTLWPIRPSDGAQIAAGVFEARSQGQTMREFLARQYQDDPLRAPAFAIMRP